MPAVNCTDDPPIKLNDDRGTSDWDEKNRSYGHAINYRCLRDGWGFPSTGENHVVSVCQSNKLWTIAELEDCTSTRNDDMLYVAQTIVLQACPAPSPLPLLPRAASSGTSWTWPATGVPTAWNSPTAATRSGARNAAEIDVGRPRKPSNVNVKRPFEAVLTFPSLSEIVLRFAAFAFPLHGPRLALQRSAIGGAYHLQLPPQEDDQA